MTRDEIDRLNNELVLERMEGESNREAEFVAVIVAVDPTGDVVICESSRCGGWIAEEPRGDKGFGYDPIFVEKTTSRTFAQLDKNRKSLLSHRRGAMEQFKERLATLDM
jgi:XTP/dITP diphosphohydrolase